MHSGHWPIPSPPVPPTWKLASNTPRLRIASGVLKRSFVLGVRACCGKVLHACGPVATLTHNLSVRTETALLGRKKGSKNWLPDWFKDTGRAPGRDRGIVMPRSTQLRFATLALFAAAAVSLTTVSAQAFSQENLNISGAGNSRFADPDDQVRNFGRGAQPFGSSGPVVQFGARQGPSTSLGRFQGSGFNNAPPPDPYSRPVGNGNWNRSAAPANAPSRVDP